MTKVVREKKKKNPNQTSFHGTNFRSKNFEIVVLDRLSLCQASPLIPDSSIYRACVEN